MKRGLTVLLITGALVGTGVTVFYSAAAAGDDDAHEWRGESRDARRLPRGLMPAADPVYQSECAACHMAYPPRLLPARSWERLMSGLDNHFGENAELSRETQEAITRYLVVHAAERAESRISAKILDGIPRITTPLRISETRYFVRKHDEIPERMVSGNPEVKSFANCAACHRGAEQGQFDEHDVGIPGFPHARF